jgi:aquaporin NIP
MSSDLKRYLGEVIGTFILVFCGCGAIVVHQETDGAVTHVGICIVWGLVVMALIYTLGEVSGCHINPAVTIALAILGLFNWRRVPFYILAQVAGAFLASLSLHAMFPENEGLGGTYPRDGNALQSWMMELFLTFFLMVSVLFASHARKRAAVFTGIVVGAVVLLEALFAGPISGASMNPARSLAPAVVAGMVGDVWVYLTATTLGAIIAAGVWRLLRHPNP